MIAHIARGLGWLLGPGSKPDWLMRFTHNVAVLMAGRVGVQAVTLLTGILLARELAPEGRGAYQAVILWPQVTGWLATLGMTKATTYFRARDPGAQPGLVANALWVCAGAGAVFALAAGMFLPRLLRGYGADVVALAIAMLALVPVIALSNVLEGLLEGAQSFRTLTVVRLTMPLLFLGGLAGLSIGGWITVTTVACLHAVSVVIVLLLLIGAVVAGGPFSVRLDPSLLATSGRYAVQYYPFMLADIALGALDQVLLVPLLPAAALGLYVIATRATIVSEVPLAISQVLFAHMPGLGATYSPRLVRLALVAGAVVGGSAALVLFVLAGPILRLLYGEAFAPAAAPFRVLLLGAVAMGMRRIVGETLGGLGRPRANSVSHVLATVALAASLSILVPRWGIMGAAWSVAGAHAFDLVVAGTWLLVTLAWARDRRRGAS